MIDIEEVKIEIVKRLRPLDPDKVILFGSYAYGIPNEDSDIDLFIVKDNLEDDTLDNYELEAKMRLLDLMKKYKTNGIDIISASSEYLKSRTDYFHKNDILKNGKILYERISS